MHPTAKNHNPYGATLFGQTTSVTPKNVKRLPLQIKSMIDKKKVLFKIDAYKDLKTFLLK